MISVIIPTYNRAHLLGATLDSVLGQTFENWECIVVDDGSKDATVELMEFYSEKDRRIQFHHRPKNLPKGANACRNYGFKLSKGKYIQWFDSDDLMLPEFLEVKFNAIETDEVDFVITKTVDFQDPNPENVIGKNEQYYLFDKFEITNYNYVVQNLNWLTPDFLGKREIVEKVAFNEKLKASQERNFFSKVTVFTVRAKIIDVYLTLRRIHRVSIQARYIGNRKLREDENLEFLIETWKDIALLAPGSKSELFFLFELIKYNKKELPTLKIQKEILTHFIKSKRYKLAFTGFLYKYSYRLTGRYFFARNLFVKSI